MSKLLIITNDQDKFPKGGRELLSKLNYDVLRLIYENKLLLYELRKDEIRGLRRIFNAFRGHIDGLNSKSIEELLLTIRESNIRQVFIDGSNLGGFVAVLKKRMPGIEIITFFHNVESRFFWGSFCLNKTLRALVVLLVNTLAERKSVLFSDKVVCLSKRDSKLLYRLYGREASHIAPMVLEDKWPPDFAKFAKQPPERFALFVGGSFYANRAGIDWFVREVVPQIDLPIYIVGHGFDLLRAELEETGKVVVVGAVDSLAEWYLRAQFVIAPIFDGSGMKTKVAEALMHGKKVVGTPEAFAGYDNQRDDFGWVCETASEFVAAIEEASVIITQSIDYSMRNIYLRKYSMNAAKRRFTRILS